MSGNGVIVVREVRGIYSEVGRRAWCKRYWSNSGIRGKRGMGYIVQ